MKVACIELVAPFASAVNWRAKHTRDLSIDFVSALSARHCFSSVQSSARRQTTDRPRLHEPFRLRDDLPDGLRLLVWRIFALRQEHLDRRHRARDMFQFRPLARSSSIDFRPERAARRIHAPRVRLSINVSTLAGLQRCAASRQWKTPSNHNTRMMIKIRPMPPLPR